MKKIFIDDRTETEKMTHNNLIVATDTFLSGWGYAKDGVSKCAWACTEKNIKPVTKWVKNRPEMEKVMVKKGNYKPADYAHYHIYVVNDNHPSIR